MRTMACACGRTEKVNDNTTEVLCSHCVIKHHVISDNPETPIVKTEAPKQVKPAPKKVEKKEKPEPKNLAITITSKTDTTASGTINNVQFSAKKELGIDKKLHWVLEGTWTHGEKIRVARTLNAHN